MGNLRMTFFNLITSSSLPLQLEKICPDDKGRAFGLQMVFCVSKHPYRKSGSAIIDLIAFFGAPNYFISDGLTHFKNETVRQVLERLKIPHQCSLPYCPWSNIAVERLGKGLLRAFRAIASGRCIARTGLTCFCWFKVIWEMHHIHNFEMSHLWLTLLVCIGLLRYNLLLDLQTRKSSEYPIYNAREGWPWIIYWHPSRSCFRSSKLVYSPIRLSIINLSIKENFLSFRKYIFSWSHVKKFSLGISSPFRAWTPSSCQNLKLLRLSRRVFSKSNYERRPSNSWKFYANWSLDTEAIMSHVLSFETGMAVQTLMKFVKAGNGLIIQVQWKGIPYF